MKRTPDITWVNVAQVLAIITSIKVDLTVGLLYCAWLVNDRHELTMNDYILYGTYILRLYYPLNFFATYYRLIQHALSDAAKALHLIASFVTWVLLNMT